MFSYQYSDSDDEGEVEVDFKLFLTRFARVLRSEKILPSFFVLRDGDCFSKDFIGLARAVYDSCREAVFFEEGECNFDPDMDVRKRLAWFGKIYEGGFVGRKGNVVAARMGVTDLDKGVCPPVQFSDYRGGGNGGKSNGGR